VPLCAALDPPPALLLDGAPRAGPRLSGRVGRPLHVPAAAAHHIGRRGPAAAGPVHGPADGARRVLAGFGGRGAPARGRRILLLLPVAERVRGRAQGDRQRRAGHAWENQLGAVDAAVQEIGEHHAQHHGGRVEQRLQKRNGGGGGRVPRSGVHQAFRSRLKRQWEGLWQAPCVWEGAPLARPWPNGGGRFPLGARAGAPPHRADA
jgi:hypothetical protein